MGVIVYTAQMSRLWKAEPDALDITIKSSRGLGAVFAPDTWDMVTGVKRGTVSTETYRHWYLSLLRRRYRQDQTAWDSVLARPRVVLLCYCPVGQFCHRHLLADVFKKLGADYCGEILLTGQLVPPSALYQAAPTRVTGGSYRTAYSDA